MTIDHRALIERFVAALNRGEPEHLGEIFTDDVVIDYPQSGEVIRGLQNMLEIIEHNPSAPPGAEADSARAHGVDELRIVAPLFTLVSVQGAGLKGSSAVRVRYPDGTRWWWVRMYELRDGRIARSTDFFAQEFDAPEWRGPWVERTGPAPTE